MSEIYKADTADRVGDMIIVNANLPDQVIADMGDITIIPFHCEDIKSYKTAAADLDPYVDKMYSTIESILERAKANNEDPMDFIKRSINYILNETFGDKGEVGDQLAFRTAFAEESNDEYPVCAYTTNDSSTPKTYVGIAVHEDDHYIEFMLGYLDAPNITTRDTRPLFKRIISTIEAAIRGAYKIAGNGRYVYDIITAPLDVVDGVVIHDPMWIPSTIKHLILVGDLDKDTPVIGGFNIDDVIKAAE